MPTPNAPSDPVRSEFADDPDMADLVEMFVSEMPDRIGALESCLREQRLGDLQSLAHQLKGAGAGYGFEPVSLIAGRLEASLKTNAELDAINAEVNELIDICRRLTP